MKLAKAEIIGRKKEEKTHKEKIAWKWQMWEELDVYFCRFITKTVWNVLGN